MVLIKILNRKVYNTVKYTFDLFCYLHLYAAVMRL